MAASNRIDSLPLNAVGAIVSLILFLIIGGCGGGTMGTQTGEQRVAVVGTAVGANGQSLANVLVDVADGEGNSIGKAKTDERGQYSVDVIVAEAIDLIIKFTTPNGTTASAAVSIANVATVTANFTVNNSGAPSVTIITTAPTPTPIQTGGVATPTNTPVPPPGATNTPTTGGPTPTPQPTPTPAPTLPPVVEPVPTEPGDACPDKGVDYDECCSKQAGMAGICCSPELFDQGFCNCEVLDGYQYRCVP